MFVEVFNVASSQSMLLRMRKDFTTSTLLLLQPRVCCCDSGQVSLHPPFCCCKPEVVVAVKGGGGSLSSLCFDGVCCCSSGQLSLSPTLLFLQARVCCFGNGRFHHLQFYVVAGLSLLLQLWTGFTTFTLQPSHSSWSGSLAW